MIILFHYLYVILSFFYINIYEMILYIHIMLKDVGCYCLNFKDFKILRKKRNFIFYFLWYLSLYFLSWLFCLTCFWVRLGEEIKFVRSQFFSNTLFFLQLSQLRQIGKLGRSIKFECNLIYFGLWFWSLC